MLSALNPRHAVPAGLPARSRNDHAVRWLLLAYLGAFGLLLIAPLATLLRRSLEDRDGVFIGLANYRAYLGSAQLLDALGHSVFVSVATVLIVVPLALGFGLALTRTCMPGRTVLRTIAFVPLVIPGMLKAIALVYLFGNQGWLRGALMGESIYGPIGIVAASVLWMFPHALLITLTSLMHADQRLYQAAQVLQTSAWRTFRHVTWPACRYGVLASALVVFVSVFTDFGIPKVIGGAYSVLATDIYKEVVGQQDFGRGAVISIVLLVPAALLFFGEQWVARRQSSQLSGRSVPFVPTPQPLRDGLAFGLCALVALGILAVLAIAQFAALVTFWPYNLSLTLANYRFDIEGVGWINFVNSLWMAGATASVGAVVVFFGAWLVEKPRHDGRGRQLLHLLAVAPMAVPGLVLGLAYLMFINVPGNPLGWLYGGMTILVLNTLTHLYGVPHLTCVTALKGMDHEIERAAETLRTPAWRTLWRVTIPVCLPAIAEVWIYLFLRAMTTLSGVIFLYDSSTTLAAIAVIHIDETGRAASAAAMGMLIVYTCLAVRLLHFALVRRGLLRAQHWRRPAAAAEAQA